MKDTIYTIPVNEVFEPKEGCPICRMRDILEERCVDYIMGAAMMEPDVRQDTNRAGFCDRHFGLMLPRKNRLSIGLMLQSHLDYLRREVIEAKAPAFGKDKRVQIAQRAREGCFVCERVEAGMGRMLDNMLLMWGREESFRQLFAGQEYVCFYHYSLLMETAQQKLPKKMFPVFADTLSQLTLGKLNELKADIDTFCNLFDYRNAHQGPVPDEVRSSLERSAAYLTSRPMEKH